MSHSSRFHASSSRHHSPDVRHGPFAITTRPLTDGDTIRTGWRFTTITCAYLGGRNRRKHSRAPGSSATAVTACRGANPRMKKLSGRCVFRTSGVPTCPSPTRCRSLANVNSSFSGSGEDGTNSPYALRILGLHRFGLADAPSSTGAARPSRQIELQHF